MSTVDGSGYAATRGRNTVRRRYNDTAREEREEQRIKALWFLHRNGQMWIAEILGLSPAAVLSEAWRETLNE